MPSVLNCVVTSVTPRYMYQQKRSKKKKKKKEERKKRKHINALFFFLNNSFHNQVNREVNMLSSETSITSLTMC